MAEWIKVAAVGEIAAGRCKVADVDGTTVAVFNVGGEFFAIEDVCTHDGGELASGVIEGDQVVCPRHGARFCLRTGRALTPPAYEAVKSHATRVVDGCVEVASE